MKQPIGDQIDIFNMLHDGCITRLYYEFQNVHFELEIVYLANILNSNFRIFHGSLNNCSLVIFDVWDNDPKIITDVGEISSLELEILDAKEEDQLLKVTCKCREDKEFYGGVLSIKTEFISLFDQNMKLISSGDLDRICNQYWNKGV